MGKRRTAEIASKVLAVGFGIVGFLFLFIYAITWLDAYMPGPVLWALVFVGLAVLFARPWPVNPFVLLDLKADWEPRAPKGPAEAAASARAEWNLDDLAEKRAAKRTHARTERPANATD